MNPATLTNEELIAATQEALRRGLFEPEPSTEAERAAELWQTPEGRSAISRLILSTRTKCAGQQPVDPMKVEQIIALRKLGATMPAISRDLGISIRTVARYLRKKR